jgi:hypothetical protein
MSNMTQDDYERAIERILQARLFKDKSYEWAKEQLDYALRDVHRQINTGGQVTPELVGRFKGEQPGGGKRAARPLLPTQEKGGKPRAS